MALTLVVIPAYGHWDYVLKAVQSVFWAAESSPFESSRDVECVVFDDASPDLNSDIISQIKAVDPRVAFTTFEKNAGMTRSWNAGLLLARERKIPYTCLANSDLLFSPGWDAPLRKACESYAMAGPVSNAAGKTSRHQDVGQYVPDYKLSDQYDDLADTAGYLRKHYPGHLISSRINGFCMMADTEELWRHAFDKDNVLDPSCPMAGNEDRLQTRLKKNGSDFAVSLASYVFHYRSVTRGDKYKKGRWMRMPGPAPGEKK